MTILITGAAGFAGCKMTAYFREADKDATLIGIDNLSRKGSEYNVPVLEELNCQFYKGDISKQEDVDALPKVDWIIDCAANPSVLAGLEAGSLDLINDNLTGTFYLLEKCKRDNAGFIMLSTSRVYSINALNEIPLNVKDGAYAIQENADYAIGVSARGIAENFSTASPISLYGATKLSSEIMALEYHYTFGFPVWINRCGVIAGPGQFGKIDQGIFSYWIYQYLLDKPLSFIGFEGSGLQARDIVHTYDVFKMIEMQIFHPVLSSDRVINLGGGRSNTYSLKQLDSYCKEKINPKKQITTIALNRKFDIPIYITDYSMALKVWGWKPSYNCLDILDSILEYGKKNIDLITRIS